MVSCTRNDTFERKVASRLRETTLFQEGALGDPWATLAAFGGALQDPGGASGGSGGAPEELWEVLYIDKLLMNRHSGRYVLREFVDIY